MTHNKKNILWINPCEVHYCTASSDYVDISQHKADLKHPHAYFDRGYFYEIKRTGCKLLGGWDDKGIEFDKLLEFEAVRDHVTNSVMYRNSRFSTRFKKYISNNQDKYPYDPDVFILNRERALENLISSARDIGIKEASEFSQDEDAIYDNISVNITRNGEYLFNNRGHHRLSVAKLLYLKKIPVLVVVTHLDYA